MRATEILSHLLSVQPFSPFDHQAAERLLTLVDRRLRSVADQIEADVEVDSDEELQAEAQVWIRPAGSPEVRTVLGEAFGMSEPPIDEAGAFRPEWVLAHYAHRAGELLAHLMPHLNSLGIPGLTDILAAVTVVGEVLSCVDPVTAYIEMDAMIGGAFAADPGTRGKVLDHLARMEPAIQRARSAAARSSRVVRDSNADTEARANALSDNYKRIVEGPFRQFAWALYCLNRRIWESPPTLGPLRDRLAAAGGGLADIAAVIIPEFRNGEAHETLVWDGFAEQFSADGITVAPDRVVASAHLAQCFVAGCGAGLTTVRYLDLPRELPILPERNEPGRMPAWRRVQAFFGTNRLRLLDASLNTRDASLRVERLGFEDVNPCFQALVLAHRLMPDVETFTVQAGTSDTVIAVTADALAASTPAWEFAVSHLDQIPLSTFLTANLDARMRDEPDSVAIRAAAWIAADDALDAIDGSPEVWDEPVRALLDTRLQVVELAAGNASACYAETGARLRSVADSVSSLRGWIATHSPGGPDLADRENDMKRLRLQWAKWGPALRHPLVPEHETPDPNERRPRLRAAPTSWAFRTL